MKEDITTLESLKKGLMAFVEGAVEESLSNTMKQVLEVRRKQVQAIENLINKYKEQEKMIELMADELSLFNAMDCDYRDYKGHECIRQDDFDGKYDRRKCKNCIIDYFRKKAKGE